VHHTPGQKAWLWALGQLGRGGGNVIWAKKYEKVEEKKEENVKEKG
jgi:hypothetical protein